ncbi:DUF2927 domain-containing protein [Ruegeria arenilitoris]|uniref:DUF2927 domain-containing protein n=1 Tax=Ruegeria arenilitoris TaxID=1173585 RepID=UPI00147CC74F|nr:DUF2927 domain-containing protein [Ruegeria arenilitoris]
MVPKGHQFRLTFGVIALLVVAGCEDVVPTVTAPQPEPVQTVETANAYVPPSAASQDLARFYKRVERDLQTRGLLRTDGGGPDTPYEADDLARNFETIAFYSEYPDDIASVGARRTDGQLSRWSGPVRIQPEFGPSVPPEVRNKDREDVSNYSKRLARLTGHPISTVSRNGNFHVFFAGKDDGSYVVGRLKQLVPNIGQSTLDLIANPRPSFDCFVFASATNSAPNVYVRAVALIRAELPDLVRLSCIHEEIAQGLGLPNDSPAARPSIFNDDDEFALLTSHDEHLLKLLYDRRLQPGVSVEDARPVVRNITRELMGL